MERFEVDVSLPKKGSFTVREYRDGEYLEMRLTGATRPLYVTMSDTRAGSKTGEEADRGIYLPTPDPSALAYENMLVDVAPDVLAGISEGGSVYMDIWGYDPETGRRHHLRSGELPKTPAIKSNVVPPFAGLDLADQLTFAVAYPAGVPEDAAIGTLVATVQGRTAGSPLTLPVNAGGRFAIDTGTGEIRVAAALDYETATSHQITVREAHAGASDSPRDTNLTISVSDIDEAPAVTAPTASGALAEQTFTEGTGVQTYDASGDFTDGGGTLAFTLATAPAGVTVASATGVVSIDTGATGTLDGSSVVVRATNSAGSAESEFSLTVEAAVTGADLLSISVPPAYDYPTLFGASGGLSLAPSADTVTLDGATASAVADLSGNGNNATEGTAASQPGYTDADGLTFDGGNDIMSFPAVSATSFTLCVGVKPGATGIYFIAGSLSAADNKLGTLNGQWFLRSTPSSTSITGGTVTAGEPYVVTAIRDGTTHTLRVNGVEIGSAATGAAAAVWDVLGDDGAGANWLGSMKNFVLVDRALSGADLAGLEAEVSTRMADGREAFDTYTHNLSGSPLVVGLHGSSRDAEGYRDSASDAPVVTSNGLGLAYPLFDETRFPSDDYQRGGIETGENTYLLLGPLVSQILAQPSVTAAETILWGYSGGGQYLSRAVAYDGVPASSSRVVIGAPSTYVWPDLTVAAPYGFGGISDAGTKLDAYLAAPITVYCGTLDNDPSDPDLATGTEAMAQGAHRLARARNFYAAGEAIATSRGVPFNWRLVEAVGIGHTHGGMIDAPEAEEAFFPSPAAEWVISGTTIQSAPAAPAAPSVSGTVIAA